MDELNKNCTELIRMAYNKGINLNKISKNPKAYANNLGIKLSEEESRFIQSFVSKNGIDAKTLYDKDVLHYIDKVIIDGRYINQCLTNPKEVAEKLEIEITPVLIQKIPEINLDDIIGYNPEGVTKIFLIGVGILIRVIIGSEQDIDISRPVVDLSKLDKI